MTAETRFTLIAIFTISLLILLIILYIIRLFDNKVVKWTKEMDKDPLYQHIKQNIDNDMNDYDEWKNRDFTDERNREIKNFYDQELNTLEEINNPKTSEK